MSATRIWYFIFNKIKLNIYLNYKFYKIIYLINFWLPIIAYIVLYQSYYIIILYNERC